MAKQPYHPPEVSLLLITRNSLLQSLSAGFSEFGDLTEQSDGWEEI